MTSILALENDKDRQYFWTRLWLRLKDMDVIDMEFRGLSLAEIPDYMGPQFLIVVVKGEISEL